MAQTTTVTYVDDIDGTKAAETISFALDCAHYEIDLSAKNAKNLRKSIAEFVAAGRTVKASEFVGRTARRKSAAPAKSASSKADLAAVRAWAADNGIQVAARGRISESLKEQYAAAQNNTAASTGTDD